MKTATPRKRSRLPDRYERLTDALFLAVKAAAKVPVGTVNLADYLDASQTPDRSTGSQGRRDGPTVAYIVCPSGHCRREQACAEGNYP